MAAENVNTVYLKYINIEHSYFKIFLQYYYFYWIYQTIYFSISNVAKILNMANTPNYHNFKTAFLIHTFRLTSLVL